ncbi:MAG: sensor histidine kinase [Bdellovibrio sp.]
MSYLNLVSDEIKIKRINYFKVIYFVGIATFAIYICKFNFQYKVTEYNSLLLFCLAIFALVPPTLLKITRRYIPAALVMGGMGTFLILYMLYMSGGSAAPGLFWLAAIPLSLGALLGLTGAYFGYGIIIITFIYFQFLSSHNLGPNIVAAHGNYEREKIFNLVIFLLFSSITTHQYVRLEQRWTKGLVEKNLDIDNLLRLLLHDIANTLSSMTYNLIKAKKTHEPDGLAHDLDRIEKSINDINNLLNQVRHLKSVKDGKASLPLKPVSLTVLLNEAYENILGSAQQKNIQVKLDIACDTMVIAGNINILGNVVLSNLLTNAVKFSHSGDCITIRAYCSEQEAVIEIEDNGIGIPSSILKDIFSVHAATSRPGTNGEKGTGYGMPLVKEYLAMMNGTIDIFSQEKKNPDAYHGTRVTLKFPQTKKINC